MKPIGAPSVRAQISCSAVNNASWQSRDTLKRQQHQNAFFFFCLWLGRVQWDEFHHLASIQKGIIELYDAACEISTELAAAAGAFGALRFCLLVNELHQIQWPQKPLTMEVLDEIHTANMHNWSTNAGRQHWAENISTQRCIFPRNRRKRGFCVKSRRSKLTLCGLFVFLL